MMDALLLRGGAVLAAGGWRTPCDLRVAHGRSIEVGAAPVPNGATEIAARRLRVVAGILSAGNTAGAFDAIAARRLRVVAGIVDLRRTGSPFGLPSDREVTSHATRNI
jgi:hypothetical protein